MLAQGVPFDDVIEKLPNHPSSIPTQFRLDPIVRTYLSCPTCHCLYPFNPGGVLNNRFHCNYQKTPESSPCNASLWKEYSRSRHKLVPRRKYLHQELKYWLGRLLSREGIEDMLDRCQYATRQGSGEPVPDIWFSEVFRELQDAGGRPFFPGVQGEGRLIFSLSIDSFNPFHMKTAKQTASSTAI